MLDFGCVNVRRLYFGLADAEVRLCERFGCVDVRFWLCARWISVCVDIRI